MTEWAIVTGAGSGIGQCLSIELARRSINVIGVGRRLDALEETARMVSAERTGVFRALSADLVDPLERKAVLDTIEPGTTLRYVAHMAGEYPVTPLNEISLDQWRQAFGVNVEARFFLTRDLLPHLVPGSRVAFMLSSTGEIARRGAAIASVSMAASNMVVRCLATELSSSRILVSATRPGAVDTESMRSVLQADPAVFPTAAEYRIKPLVSPETCGRYLIWWLTETPDEDFISSGWNLEDHSHHRHWASKKDGRS